MEVLLFKNFFFFLRRRRKYYTRSTSAAQTSAARTSATRTSAARTSAARTSATRTSAARTSATRTSAARTSAAHTSATRTSAARTSAAHTSTTRTSTAHTSAARTSAAHTSAASTRRSFHKTTRFLRDTSRWRSAYQVVGSRAIDSNNIFSGFFWIFFLARPSAPAGTWKQVRAPAADGGVRAGIRGAHRLLGASVRRAPPVHRENARARPSPRRLPSQSPRRRILSKWKRGSILWKHGAQRSGSGGSRRNDVLADIGVDAFGCHR